jgi:recombination protein RecT
MAENKNEVSLKRNVGDQVIERVNSLCEAGFSMPKDFNYVNAVKMTMLKLQDLRDKNGKSCLEVCTQLSIQTALFKMCCRGLNAATNQCYPIVRGNQLCIDDSYFGKTLMVKRVFPDWEPRPNVIREGDVFEYGINAETGRKYIIKHETKLENIDKDFIGGYMYLPCKNGENELYLMSKKQILTAWSKSSSREQATHKQFDEKMIGKTLVNSGCNMIINSTPEYQEGLPDEDIELNNRLPKIEESHNYTDFEEVQETVDTDTGEIKEEVQEQPKDEEF